MSNKIPELLRDAKQRAAAILTEIDDLTGRGNLTPGQEERLERQVSAGERIHGEIEALEVAQTEMLREAFANGWVGGGSTPDLHSFRTSAPGRNRSPRAARRTNSSTGRCTRSTPPPTPTATASRSWSV